MNINEMSTANKLLSSPENVAIYMALFHAHIDSKNLTINEIENYIQTKYKCEIDRNKIWTVLKLLMDNAIINKEIQLNNKKDKYYLMKVIYTPKFYTPIPTYQFLMFGIVTTTLMYIYAFIDNIFLFQMFLTSFATIVTIMILHYITFDVIRLNYSVPNIRKNKIITGVITIFQLIKTKCTL